MLLSAMTLSFLVALQPATIEAPFRLAEDAIIVDAEVNGRQVSLMYDSGFSGSVILTDNVNVGRATGTMNLRDFVGQFQARTVPLNTLKIGGKVFRPEDAEIVQKPMEHLSMSYGTHVDGLLGLAPMGRSVFEINFERKRFIFYPDSTDISTRRPDNKRTFMVRMLPRGVNSIELTVNTQAGRPLHLALDTGNAFYIATHREVLERVGLWQPGSNPRYMSQSMVASGPVDSWSLAVEGASIYGVPVPRSVWRIIDLPPGDANNDGTVGFQFLKHFNITVDMLRRRVWLENWTDEVVGDPVAEVGLVVLWNPNRRRFVVVNVTPNGPAAEAGIQEGDQLLGVDGTELLNMGFRQANRLLEGAPGSTVILSLSRGGQLRRIELQRRPLFNAPPQQTSG